MEVKFKSFSPKIWLFCFALFSLLFAVYSYSFLDIGLTLTSFQPFLEFQRKMRWFGYFNRPRSTLYFVLISLLTYLFYFLVSKAVKSKKILLKEVIILSLGVGGIFVFAYPAFSHDIFNYIFNAKMIVVYGADPHKHVAMEFPDPMLGFMRNIHTAAPYFYGWTVISLIPFILGLNRIFTEILSFKAFSFLFYWFTFLILRKLFKDLKLKDRKLRLVLFLLNPLILIEAIGVGHNDFSMMAPALLSFYFLNKIKKERITKEKLKLFLFFVFFFLFSVSIKYATVVLLPLFLLWYFKPKFDLGFWGAVILFGIQFSRFGLMHSWYFIWPLTWAILAKNIKAVKFFVLISFMALLRYLPYIWYGNWNPPVPIFRQYIYFIIPLLTVICYFFYKGFKLLKIKK